MKFGFFDDQNREYVITQPQTPYPWINYLGNKDFFTLISNTGGGYSFFRDARLRRITRYRYNNVPVDDGGKYFYINDNDTVWSPGWKPVKTTLDSYMCRHGLGYSVIQGIKNGLEAEVLYMVPLGDQCEIQKVHLVNHSDSVKSVKLFTMVEWCLWNALDDMTNFQRNYSTGQVEVEDGVIFHKTEYRERRNHFAFYGTSEPISGYDTDRESFLGAYNGFDHPQVVYKKQSTNSFAHGWSPIASHFIEVELKPHEYRDIIFVLGYVENPENEKFISNQVINKKRALAMISRYDTIEKGSTSVRRIKG